MKSFPTQERAIKKRIALLKAAIKEFGTVGFEAATAKSIAAAAGVATGTFYQYFENKNDILRVVAAERFSSLHQQVELLGQNLEIPTKELTYEQIEARFIAVLTFLHRFHVEDAPLHQVLDQRRGVDEKLEEIIAKGESLMLSHVIEFVEGIGLSDPQVIAETLFAMGEGLVHRMVFGKPPQNEKKMLELGARILSNSIYSDLKATH